MENQAVLHEHHFKVLLECRVTSTCLTATSRVTALTFRISVLSSMPSVQFSIEHVSHMHSYLV